ncbi:hypothetical protein DESC_460070 [Desulfosarcina cetonica]|nr:hypothetical protein DESC_460070 [Desulfosarcina cetonica]
MNPAEPVAWAPYGLLPCFHQEPDPQPGASSGNRTEDRRAVGHVYFAAIGGRRASIGTPYC